MIFSHIEYCFTNWMYAGATDMKSIEQLFNRSIKVFAIKPLSHHHCNILEQHHFFSFENFKVFKGACFIYRWLHGLAPPPVQDFIKKKKCTGLGTRSDTRGDCEIQRRLTTFGQNVLSIKGGLVWNSLPVSLRESPTFATFKGQLKKWLKADQKCGHL